MIRMAISKSKRDLDIEVEFVEGDDAAQRIGRVYSILLNAAQRALPRLAVGNAGSQESDASRVGEGAGGVGDSETPEEGI